MINNKTGFIVEERNINAIVDKTVKLFEDKKLCKEFGENTLKNIKQNFNKYNI